MMEKMDIGTSSSASTTVPVKVKVPIESSSGGTAAPEKSLGKKTRVAAHSHVKGLGLDPDTGKAHFQAHGFIGQMEAREAAGIVVDLVRQKKMSGRAVLLAGPPGTGKTAIAMAVAHELGECVPFVPLVASEVFSSEVKKTEVLMEHFRRALSIRVKETKEVFEGEVVEIQPVETENPIGGYGKAISHVLFTMKTSKGSRELKLDPAVYDSLLMQKVAVGDVVYIEAGTGAVKRMGRSDIYANEFDLEAEEFVPMPKGDVHKHKEVIQFISLYDFDQANAAPHGRSGNMLSVMSQLLRPKKTEITERLRNEVNKAINGYIESGQAELLPGILFIDEVHMLDLECFTFLHRALESPVSPIIIFATNRGMARVRNDDNDQPRFHGIPADLLDRLLIVPTKGYNQEETAAILKIRADAEGVRVSAKAMAKLCEVSETSSLRYTIQLLSPAKLLAAIAGRETVEVEDVCDAASLFMDYKTSARILLADEQAAARPKPPAAGDKKAASAGMEMETS